VLFVIFDKAEKSIMTVYVGNDVCMLVTTCIQQRSQI